MEDEEEVTVETTQQAEAQPDKPIGRAAILAKWKRLNPDAENEPSEEELWEIARENYDGLKGRHNQLSEGSKGLADYVAKDPRFGAAIGMSFGEGEGKIPLMQSLGKLYGPDAFNDSEEFMSGVAEFNEKFNNTKKEQEQADLNFAELTVPRLEKFAKDKNLTDAQLGEILNGLMSLAENMLMGDIPENAIALIHKGLNYDTDVQEAIATGEVEGKNQVVKAKMKEKTQAPSGVVDMGSGTGETSRGTAEVSPGSRNFFGGFPGKR